MTTSSGVAIHLPVRSAPLRTPVPEDDRRGGGLRVRLADDQEDLAPRITVGTGAGPVLPLAGTDRTNLPTSRFGTDYATRQSREGVVQLQIDRGGMRTTGSGWVARPGVVVTNHHVISTHEGAKRFAVVDHRGVERTGRVIADDPAHDLALVHVPGLTDAPFGMDDVVEFGEDARTVGYPGGRFNEGPAAALIGAEVLQNGAKRDGILFAGLSAPGGSGGPVINNAGEVLATTFAVGDANIRARGYEGPYVTTIPNRYVQELLARTPEPA